MVEVTYHCPYCGAVTGLEREGYLDDDCVTREPLDGWRYVSTTADPDERAAADGVEFVCLGDDGAGDGGTDGGEGEGTPPAGGANDPNPEKDGCGRTFYLNFRRSENGRRIAHRRPDIDPPRFDFRP